MIDQESDFSIVCHECDAGMDVRCKEEALMLGWMNVHYDDDPDCRLPGANHIGTCPECFAKGIVV